jgi:hypothetical protein
LGTSSLYVDVSSRHFGSYKKEVEHYVFAGGGAFTIIGAYVEKTVLILCIDVVPGYFVGEE